MKVITGRADEIRTVLNEQVRALAEIAGSALIELRVEEDGTFKVKRL